MNKSPEYIEADRMAQCDGKLPFKNREDADKALKRIHKKGMHHHSHSQKGRKIQVYLCPCCGFFHHGHQKVKKRWIPSSQRIA